MAPSKLTTIDFESFSNIIDGELRGSKTKYHGVDPTTKEPNWDVPVATPEDIDDAVAAANKAAAEWKNKSWEYRTERLVRYREAFEAYRSEMIELLLKETGKPRMFGTVEVDSAFQFIDWHIKMKAPEGTTYEDDTKKIVNKFVPLGVWSPPRCLIQTSLLTIFRSLLPSVRGTSLCSCRWARCFLLSRWGTPSL